MATTNAEEPWQLDFHRFRTYLFQKYRVKMAYYFMGAYEQKCQDLYIYLQNAGYTLIFREHSVNLKGKKKGNVDVDIVFQLMRDFHDGAYNRALLVSNDGDYKRVVEYLIEQECFETILHPSKRYASSLYKSLSNKKYAYLDTPDMRAKLGIRKKNGELRY